MSVIGVIFEIIIPLCMADLIDFGINNKNINDVFKYGTVLLIIALLDLIIGMLSAHIGAKASTGFAANLRQDMYDNVQTFSFSNIDKFSTASIITRLTTDVTNLQNAYQMLIRIAIRVPIMIIFSIIVSFRINNKISLIFLIIIPILTTLLIIIVLKVHPIFQKVFRDYDGININKIKKTDLRRSLGIVLQDVHVFTGTIMENIRYGNPNATDEECISTAKLVNADNFIRMLPQGYNTILKGANSTLSHGQLQLISIARTAVANPPVMILDEATSSIDTRTEVLVQDGMNKLMKGRTVFIIAHRLSTIQNADTIIVLDHGKIIERGSHEQLIEKKGTYYSLHTNAFELQ